MGRREKPKRSEKRIREPSLSKGVIGKFQLAHKPDRFDRAKLIDTRINQPEGRGTHRSEGSNLVLSWKSTALKGRETITGIRKKHRQTKGKMTSKSI